MAAMQRYYEDVYGPQSLEHDRARINRLAFLFPDDMRDRRILDVGCGPGVQFLAHVRHNEFHGIDISTQALREAARNGIIPHQFAIGEEPLPFPNCSFDAVICTDIFEHLFDPLVVLAEVRRVLKDDGVLIASVPNHFMWWMLIRLARNQGLVLPYHRDKSWNYCHLRFFTTNSFEQFLKAGNMDIMKRHYDAFPSFHWFIPRFMRPWLIRHFPDKFSFHFLVEAVKTETSQASTWSTNVPTSIQA